MLKRVQYFKRAELSSGKNSGLDKARKWREPSQKRLISGHQVFDNNLTGMKCKIRGDQGDSAGECQG